MTTLTDGTTTLTPRLVLGWEGYRAARTVVHDILADPDGYVTLRPSSPEALTLQLLLDTAEESLTALTLLGSGQLLTLTIDELPTLTMNLVVVGDATRALDDQTLTRWIVTAEVRQVV